MRTILLTAYRDITPQTRRAAVFALASLVTLAVAFAVTRTIIESNASLPRWEIVGLSSVPIVPFLATLYGGVLVYRAADEYYRQLQAQGMIWGFVLGIAVCVPWSFLQNVAAVPRFEPIYVEIVLMLGYIAGTVAATAKCR